MGTIKAWIRCSFFLTVVVCIYWVGPSVYSIKYAVSANKVYLDPKPKDCDFWRVPLGTKGCHYQRVVIGQYAKGVREMRPGEADPEQFESLLISWVKKTD